MDHTEAQAFAKQWAWDWNAHDIGGLLKHFTDDVVFTSPVAIRLFGSDGVVRGKEALRKYWTEGVRLIVVCEVLTFDGPLIREGHGTYFAQPPTGREK